MPSWHLSLAHYELGKRNARKERCVDLFIMSAGDFRKYQNQVNGRARRQQLPRQRRSVKISRHYRYSSNRPNCQWVKAANAAAIVGELDEVPTRPWPRSSKILPDRRFTLENCPDNKARAVGLTELGPLPIKSNSQLYRIK